MADSSAFFAMRPKPLLAHWVPGLVFTIIAMLTLPGARREALLHATNPYGGIGVALAALAILSYVMGQVFDAVRDILEYVYYKLSGWIGWRDVEWYFFVKAEDRYIANAESWFFTYYILNFNLTICLLTLFVLGFVNSALTFASWERWVLIAVAMLFLADAVILRLDLIELTNDLTPNKDGE